MATGQSAQPRRGIETSAIAPTVNLDNGESQMWASVGRLADQVGEVVKEGQVRKARELGAEEGRALAAGEIEAPERGPLFFGDVADARRAAFEQSYVAGVSTDFDAQEDEVRREFGHDPRAYQERMAAVRSGFIQGAPPEFAVAIEQYAARRTTAGAAAISDAVERVRLQEANVEIGTRQGTLTSKLIRMLREGKGNTIEYEILNDERDQLVRSRLENPAIVYSPAEAAKDDQEFAVAAKAAIYTHHAIDVLRNEGADAAIGSLQAILKDPSIADPTERQAAFESARAAVNQEIDLATDRANIAARNRTQAEAEIKRRIDDDAAAIEIGAPDTGLTEAEVLAVLGPSGVAEWRRKQAEASQRNRLTGSLIGLPRDEAVRRAEAALGGDTPTVADLSKPIKTPADLDALAAAVRMVETANNPARKSEAGAIGAMQLLPETARQMAQLEGVPYDENRLLNDPAYNERLGKRYLTQLLDKYDGDQLLAVTAYHAGPGVVDAWLKPEGVATRVRLGNRTVTARGRGDPRAGDLSTNAWLDSIAPGNPNSAAYPRKVAAALGGGRNTAEWRRTQAETIVTNAQQGFASDPLNFASTHRVAALPQLNVDGVFAGGDLAAQWGQAIRGRANLGGQLAAQHGVPQRYLTNGEAAAYRDRIERDPAAAVTLARQATAALGGRGARDLLAEVGQNSGASTAIHIADLGAAGGDVRFADAAAQGIALKQQGQTLDTERKNEIDAEMRRWRSAVAGSPSLLAAVANTAQAAALADSVSGFDRPAEYYVQAALGRTTWGRNRYGGAAEVNSATVVVPRWLNGEYFDDALALLPERPIYDNGQPMPAASVSRLRPALQPNGNYRLLDHRGRVAYGRNRQPYEVDFDQYRDLIRTRLGTGAVRPD
jgi:hypothetical protein